MVETRHTVDFFEEREWLDEENPEPFETLRADEVHIPDIHERIEFGYFTIDGERVNEISEEEELHLGGDDGADYETSSLFLVVEKKTHYHHSRVRKNSRQLVDNALEIITSVVLRETSQ